MKYAGRWAAVLMLAACGNLQAQVKPGATPAPGQGAASPAQATPPASGRRLLIVSIDGLRPDVSLRADMPHLRKLMEIGSFTFWAQTTKVAITLPSHTTMLTGVAPEQHKIDFNKDPAPGVAPAVPTIFQLAKAAGYSTGMAAGKSKFEIFTVPPGLDWSWHPSRGNSQTTDLDVAREAVKMIQEHQPALMFVHLPAVDAVGHKYDWGSPEQIQAAEEADQALGQVLEAIDATGRREQTLVLFIADHGGQCKTHGGEIPTSAHIPFVMSGPGVKRNFDMTRVPKLTVKIEDVFTTGLNYLQVATPSHVAARNLMADMPR